MLKQTVDRAGGVVGMERAQDEVAREGRFDRDFSGLEIPYFTRP